MKTYIVCVLLIVTFSCSDSQKLDSEKVHNQSPRIVNIVNFIRQCEPRIDWITEEVLYETVVSQIEIMKEYQLKGSFLLQYDALIEPADDKVYRHPTFYSIPDEVKNM